MTYWLMRDVYVSFVIFHERDLSWLITVKLYKKILSECDICGSASERYLICVCLLMYLSDDAFWAKIYLKKTPLTLKHVYIRGKGH